MMPDLLAFPQVERLGRVLLHALWQGALIALALHAALDALRDCSADLRYTVCLAALIVFVTLPAARWHVDRLRDAGFFARFDTPRLPDIDVRAFARLDTLRRPNLDLDYDFDSLFALHESRALVL